MQLAAQLAISSTLHVNSLVNRKTNQVQRHFHRGHCESNLTDLNIQRVSKWASEQVSKWVSEWVSEQVSKCTVIVIVCVWVSETVRNCSPPLQSCQQHVLVLLLMRGSKKLCYSTNAVVFCWFILNKWSWVKKNTLQWRHAIYSRSDEILSYTCFRHLFELGIISTTLEPSGPARAHTLEVLHPRKSLN